jgi:RP/EB family microtubule-associated protein
VSNLTSIPNTHTSRTSKSYRVRPANCVLECTARPYQTQTNTTPPPDTLTRHGIDRSVPVEQLVKCKLQDNLEFLQWSKRHWDQYYPGHEYDALARRKASGSGSSAPAPTASRTSTGGAGAARRPAGASAVSSTRAAPRVAAAAPATSALRQENESLKEAIAGLEKERDFYFSKLRDIELLLQTAVENEPAIENDENGLVKNIQAILYSTEEGFEIPAEVEDGMEANGEEPETF